MATMEELIKKYQKEEADMKWDAEYKNFQDKFHNLNVINWNVPLIDLAECADHITKSIHKNHPDNWAEYCNHIVNVPLMYKPSNVKIRICNLAYIALTGVDNITKSEAEKNVLNERISMVKKEEHEKQKSIQILYATLLLIFMGCYVISIVLRDQGFTCGCYGVKQ